MVRQIVCAEDGFKKALEFRHDYGEGLRLKYLLLVGAVTIHFWHVNCARKCSEKSKIF